VGGHDDGADVVLGVDAALGADQQRLLAVADAAGAVVPVVLRQRLGQHRRGDAARRHRRRVRRDLVGADEAAEVVHVGDAGQAAEPRADGPIEDGPPLHRREVAALDGEHQHLAERRHHRREAAGDAVREGAFQIVQPLVHLGARPVDVGAWAELEGHQGGGVAGDGADVDQVRDAPHRQLDDVGHLALQFLRRQAGRLDRHQHLRGRDVGKGVDRQLAVGVDAPEQDPYGGEQGDQALAQRQVHQASEHGSFSPRRLR
jgi:hypothetical protein